MTTLTLKNGQIATLAPLGERPQFVDRVAAVIFAEWADFWRGLGFPSADKVADWLRAMTGPDSLPYYAVVHIDDELIGCAGVDANEREGDPRGPWLIDVVVLEKHRGCGAFKPLVLHIMEVQQNRGVPEMYLWTTEPLVRVYEKLGWKYLQHEEWTTEGQGLVPQPTLSVDLSTLDLKTL